MVNMAGAPSWRDAIGIQTKDHYSDALFAPTSYDAQLLKEDGTFTHYPAMSHYSTGWQDLLWLAGRQFILQAIANPVHVSKLLLQCQYVPTEEAENPRRFLYTPAPPAPPPDEEEEEEEEADHPAAISPAVRDVRYLAASLNESRWAPSFLCDDVTHGLNDARVAEEKQRQTRLHTSLTNRAQRDENGYFATGPLLAPQRCGPWRMTKRVVETLGFSGLWRGCLVGVVSRLATTIIQPSLEAALNDHFQLFDEGLVPIVQLDSPWANYGTLCLSQSITHFLLLPLDVLYTRAVLASPKPQKQAQSKEKLSLWQRVTAYYPHPWTSLLYFTVSPLLKNLSPLLLGQWMHITNPWVYGIAAFAYCTLELVTLMPLQTACRRLWAQGWSERGWRFISLRHLWRWVKRLWRHDDVVATSVQSEEADEIAAEVNPITEEMSISKEQYDVIKANSIVQLSPKPYNSSRDLISRIVREEGRIWRILGGAFLGQFEGLYRCFWMQSVANVALIALATLSRLEVDEDDFVE